MDNQEKELFNLILGTLDATLQAVHYLQGYMLGKEIAKNGQNNKANVIEFMRKLKSNEGN